MRLAAMLRVVVLLLALVFLFPTPGSSGVLRAPGQPGQVEPVPAGGLTDGGSQSVPVADEEGQGRPWTRLFDGQTLRGWKVKGQPADCEKGFWTVRDGALVADSMPSTTHDYVWLVSEGEYDDFELRMKVRSHADSPGNSGIQVRSRYDEAARWLDGPQVDLHPPAGWRCGLIYDETRGHQRWIFPSLPDWRIEPAQGPRDWEWNQDGWNEVRIRCQGTRIRTWINGRLIADYDGAGVLDDEIHARRGVGMKGCLALQIHRHDRLRIAFKELDLRPLRD